MEPCLSFFQFKHPFTCMVAGPTSSGKTVFVRKLLENQNTLIANIVDIPKIIWMYGQWQASYGDVVDNVNITYNDGLMSQDEIISSKPDIIVIDDLMTEIGNNIALSNLFTKGSHHLNISIIFIVQNIFHQAKQMRNVSLNSHYFILMKNPRDKSQIMHLGRQLYPKNIKFIIDAYEDATKEPYGYIKIDLTAATPEKFRVQTNIFVKNNLFSPVIYLPK